MAAKSKARRKVRIGGTVDSDVADWLNRTKGKEKFSKHLNSVLRSSMESGGGAQPSMDSFRNKLDSILEKITALQEKVEGPGKAAAEAPAKRPRGRPRKLQSLEHIRVGGKEIDTLSTDYDVRNDLQWFLSRDRYKKVKAEPLVNAFDMVVSKLDTGKNLTVGTLKEGYDRAAIGVPYPTFRLFYFPLIRDRLLEKKMIEKVDRPGKKGVYRKR
ncbi:MAG: hypothetical protein A4E28_01195 [Methanocella sp. PtaU1.Bin125]|nr:MAG: hypothetical protein A4E28_01195 [Methanocella sp. PtaU1.Bin125]